MKVSNDYVEIKIGNKKYIKKNMILNTYIKRLFDSQLYTDHNTSEITSCYLKLDTPIENVDYDSLLYRSDFDISIITKHNPSIILTKNLIKITYKFDDFQFFYKGENNLWSVSSSGIASLFLGRKITGIGFQSGSIINPVLAYLDTNDMNIIINMNEEISITRVDNIQSDGIAKGIEKPLHLANDVIKKDRKTIFDNNVEYSETTMAQLYSVGFGNTLGLMEEEYLIDDVEVDRDDTYITFDVSRIKKIGNYPSEDLHFDFYPTIDNSKYLLFKYRLYRRYYNSDLQEYIITYLDEYYTMSKPNENFGNLEIKLEIERS